MLKDDVGCSDKKAKGSEKTHSHSEIVLCWEWNSKKSNEGVVFIRKPEVSSQTIPILSTVRTFYSSKTIHTCTDVNLRCSALNVFLLPPFFLPF